MIKTAKQTDVGGAELAIFGGPRLREEPLPPWPYFGPDEIEAASAVLASGRVNYWTGDEGRLFESEFALQTGCGHAIALANGTVALELALYALGIGPGDEVITTSRTFIASASCVVMRGAVPVVADVDPVSQNVTAETIAAKMTSRTKAIIVVHLAGWPCDMDPIVALARQHGLKVIEDCAQALGAAYKGRPVGSLGDVAAFSFCQDKILTTAGEGGMLTTNDEEIWEMAWSFKDHGKSWRAVYGREHPPGFRWLHESFGTNWRLSEVQSAVGRRQLAKVPEWVEARRRYAAILNERFSGIDALRLTIPPEGVQHAYYKYYAFLRPERLRPGWTRDRIIEAVNAEGIPCYSGSCSEIYLEKAFRSRGYQPDVPLQNARELGNTALMLLVHPTLRETDIEDTAAAVGKVIATATS
ncbi:MAG: DegT/DnrJ/EryC1/StrS aminotransferase family protein [Thermoanaerobaculia bacterium]